MFHSDLIEHALRFASSAHCDQYRKGSDVPYIMHPAAVMEILLRAEFTNETILAAALLHDVIEDTPVSEEQLAAEFPESVVNLVRFLSEEKRHPGGEKIPWLQRKKSHIAKVRNSPLEARAIVLADKCHNLHSLLYDLKRDDTAWNKFNASASEMIWYHQEMIAAAAQSDEALHPLLQECLKVLEGIEKYLPEGSVNSESCTD